jgi:hypothetical protein
MAQPPGFIVAGIILQFIARVKATRAQTAM